MTGQFYVSDHSPVKEDLSHLVQWLDEKTKSGKYRAWNVAIVNGPDHENSWNIAGGQLSWTAVHRTKKFAYPIILILALCGLVRMCFVM